jgi:AcrR family transcriptional regulator
VVSQQTEAARPSGRPASERRLRARGRRTQAKLLDAGLEAFSERGYHAARVDDVVRLAATSHGTFYLYFSNKEDLLRALADECAAEMQRLADELGDVTPDPVGHGELRRWIGGFHRTYTRYGAVIRVWMEDQVPDPDMHRMGTEAFARLAATLGGRMHAAGGGCGGGGGGGALPADLAPVVLLAMVERFTYFMDSRDLGLDVDAALDDLAVLAQRAFF